MVHAMLPSHPDLAALTDSLREPIECSRRDAEARRRLPAELVELLRAAGVFRISTPAELGGWELPLLTQAPAYDGLGRLDGPTAWNVWNGNIGFAAAMLPPDGVGEIWSSDSDPIIANSARVGGQAVPVADGFEVSGRWDIVSAIDIADWVGVFAIVLDGDGPRMTPSGPDVRVVFLQRGEFAVLDTWHTTGMRATGSNTVVVDRVVIPERRTVSPFGSARIDRPLYRVPAFTIASHGSAPIVIGMAQSAIDELLALAARKQTEGGTLAQRPQVHECIARAQTTLDAARALLFDCLASIDRAAADAESVDELSRARLRAAMAHAGEAAREVVSTCFQLASSSAIYTDAPIERIWRDTSVATQHQLLAATNQEALGRMMCGLDAGSPVI